MKTFFRAAAAAAALCLTPVAAHAQAPASKPAAPAWVWDLTDLYATPAAWDATRDEIAANADDLKALEGTLGKSPAAMADAFEAIWGVYKDAIRLSVYASLKADEDVRDADNDARRQRAQLLVADLTNAVSWLDPELLAIGEKKVRRFLDREDRLQDYAFYIEDVLRQAPHTLSAEAEAIMAATNVVRAGPGDVYNTFANADMPWPEVTLASGEKATISQAGYSRYRQAPNRADRKKVFDAFWGLWGDYESTYGAVLGAHLQGLRLQTSQRDYDSSVARALFGDDMPPAVYETLIAQVNEALPTLHRYFRLRKKMLGIEDELRYYDIYPSLVALDKEFSIETSISLTRDALAPLGAEYLAAYDKGVAGQWMHVYPKPGKRSGAYMSGSAYDVHPYVLLNHNDDFESASTFAHEYGHAVHSVLANAVQPWPTAGYSTFIAETASIMNEMLLSNLVVSRAASDDERLYYLGQALESLRGTYFRQAMFAEFELKANELVDAGEPVTGKKLTEIYLDLLKRYHGHDEGVMTIDETYAAEWAYIPHFYYDFYVFQYATSIAAASALAEAISSGDDGARDRFVDLLKAGGSDHPYDLMKKAGVDLATSAPHEALEARMNAIMDEMEAILAKG
ncbi:MAG: oligoendopeptidase F [Parvularculaceae bacterium]